MFARRFVVLDFSGKAADTAPLADAFARRNVPLAVVAITEPEVAAVFERRPVLARPDGHNAWRGDDPPADPMAVVECIRGA